VCAKGDTVGCEVRGESWGGPGTDWGGQTVCRGVDTGVGGTPNPQLEEGNKVRRKGRKLKVRTAGFDALTESKVKVFLSHGWKEFTTQGKPAELEHNLLKQENPKTHKIVGVELEKRRNKRV